jgi:type VI secretion system ImpA family protein
LLDDLESLLAPIDGEDPAGPDLDSDPVMVELRTAFDSGFTDEKEHEPLAGWSSIADTAESLLARSKDIWIAVYLMRAAAKEKRLDRVLKGALLLLGLTERYWDNVHPKLEDWGINARITPIVALGSRKEFVIPLKRITLVEHPRLGQYSGADFVRFQQNGDGEPDFGKFKAVLMEADHGELRAVLATFEDIENTLKAVDRAFMINADGEGPNLTNLYDGIKEIRASVLFHIGDDSKSASNADESIENAGYAAESALGSGWGTGRIEARDDVIRAIDSISDYYRRKEPGSPVPVVLQRVRAWVTLDFLSILQDIAPNSIDEAQRVLLFTKEEYATSEE